MAIDDTATATRADSASGAEIDSEIAMEGDLEETASATVTVPEAIDSLETVIDLAAAAATIAPRTFASVARVMRRATRTAIVRRRLLPPTTASDATPTSAPSVRSATTVIVRDPTAPATDSEESAREDDSAIGMEDDLATVTAADSEIVMADDSVTAMVAASAVTVAIALAIAVATDSEIAAAIDSETVPLRVMEATAVRARLPRPTMSPCPLARRRASRITPSASRCS